MSFIYVTIIMSHIVLTNTQRLLDIHLFIGFETGKMEKRTSRQSDVNYSSLMLYSPVTKFQNKCLGK